MNSREAGFLLLTSHLGDPCRRPLTVAQFRVLAERVRNLPRSVGERDLEIRDLNALGYSEEMARRILQLLSEEEVLEYYLSRSMHAGCGPVSRISEAYPLRLRKTLGLDAPGCLWARGDIALLDTPMIALVGSRNLRTENRRFAEEVGRQAARQGYTLVSGNARGADQAAQNACLAHGGSVISVVADALAGQPLRERMLYLSEDGFDEGFSAQRALSRNRVIHALGEKTFVAQCSLKTGGTWDGTVKNLRFGWSSVYCFDDSSEAAGLLEQMGAQTVKIPELRNISGLRGLQQNLFE